jgi:hypothetical protein
VNDFIRKQYELSLKLCVCMGLGGNGKSASMAIWAYINL